ncbi:hypothetical protein EC957_011655 [Mortierella hygrophila]|uniref:Uncharacterized protein n=1 Tax=Mortierella hygrophila TaxID=979708 RepID=A0A9P6F8F2_9FUNG|nr:hypothetical protein EC957_011655 [Mortierella hygrophila]
MRTSTALLATLLVAVATVSAQDASTQPETPLPCYEQTCSPLISALSECQITIDSATGNINFPVTADTSGTTDKCLCKQSIVDAYDPCYTCGAQSSKIQDRYSTLSLVNSCNANFGANTVVMPGKASSASSVRAGSLAATAVAVASVAFMVLA